MSTTWKHTPRPPRRASKIGALFATALGVAVAALIMALLFALPGMFAEAMHEARNFQPLL